MISRAGRAGRDTCGICGQPGIMFTKDGNPFESHTRGSRHMTAVARLRAEVQKPATPDHKAKAGDAIEPKAREALARAMGGNIPMVCIPERVVAKTDGQHGQWFCITCGALPQNNMQADTHEREKPTHKLGWRGATGEIEEP